MKSRTVNKGKRRASNPGSIYSVPQKKGGLGFVVFAKNKKSATSKASKIKNADVRGIKKIPKRSQQGRYWLKEVDPLS